MVVSAEKYGEPMKYKAWDPWPHHFLLGPAYWAPEPRWKLMEEKSASVNGEISDSPLSDLIGGWNGLVTGWTNLATGWTSLELSILNLEAELKPPL